MAFTSQRWLHYKCQRHLRKVTVKKIQHQTTTYLEYCSIPDYDACVLLFCDLGTKRTMEKCSLFLENQTLPQKSNLMKATLSNFAHNKMAVVAKTGFKTRNIGYLSLTTEKHYL